MALLNPNSCSFYCMLVCDSIRLHQQTITLKNKLELKFPIQWISKMQVFLSPEWLTWGHTQRRISFCVNDYGRVNCNLNFTTDNVILAQFCPLQASCGNVVVFEKVELIPGQLSTNLVCIIELQLPITSTVVKGRFLLCWTHKLSVAWCFIPW